MKVRNTVTGTTPLILHAQGQASRGADWNELVEVAKRAPIDGLPEDVTIVTFAANRERAVLVEQLTAADVPFINAAASHRTYWQNVYKIKYLVQAIANINTRYVLALDARDVLLAEDLSDLLESFHRLDCAMLYGATMNRFPPTVTADVESGVQTPWKYLNAGTMLGETEFVREFYDYLLAHEKEFGELAGSEQARIRVTWSRFRPRIKADYSCAVFQTLGGASWSLADQLLTITGIAPPDPAEVARKEAAAARASLREWWAQLPREDLSSEERAGLRMAKAAVLDALADHDIDDVRAVIAGTAIPQRLEPLRAQALATVSPDPSSKR